MILSLIGMSGAGKSHWSQRLEKAGFKHYCIDDMLEAKLAPELTKVGYSGIADVSKWMGQPYDERHARTSAQYLALEEQCVTEALKQATRSSEDAIIDTTGSVIYLPDAALTELAGKTDIVYFHTPEARHGDMLRTYLADPKPVLWGNAYQPHAGETPQAALARCYPELLRDRTGKYQKLAHFTFDFDQLRGPDMTAQKMVDAVRARV